MSKDSIANTLDTTVIRYSKVWEDHEALSEGLNLNKDDVVLCITRYLIGTIITIILAVNPTTAAIL